MPLQTSQNYGRRFALLREENSTPEVVSFSNGIANIRSKVPACRNCCKYSCKNPYFPAFCIPWFVLPLLRAVSRSQIQQQKPTPPRFIIIPEQARTSTEKQNGTSDPAEAPFEELIPKSLIPRVKTGKSKVSYSVFSSLSSGVSGFSSVSSAGASVVSLPSSSKTAVSSSFSTKTSSRSVASTRRRRI